MTALNIEKKIISNWKTDPKNPIISIICTTFNHEQYIAEALNSFLSQKTQVPFEIIVHDDASTDSTQQIIQEYKKKYPNIIKTILQKTNQYSQGKKIPPTFIYPIVKGKYVAICEGDDYWIDEYKLDKQYNILEQHHTINMCLHLADLQCALTNKITGTIGKYKVDNNLPIIPFEDIITKKYGNIPTASTFIRSTILNKIQEFSKINTSSVGDIYLHMFGAYSSGAYLINEVMSIYRINTPGSWTVSMSQGSFKRHEITRAQTFKKLEGFFEPKYWNNLQNITDKRLHLYLRSPYPSKKNKENAIKLLNKKPNAFEFVILHSIIQFNFLYKIFFKLKNLMRPLYERSAREKREKI